MKVNDFFIFKRNILKIESESELKEFIGSLIDLSLPKNKSFLNELLTKLKRPSEFSDIKVYVKPKIVDDTSSKFKSSKNQSSVIKTENEELTSQESQASKKSGFNLFPSDIKKHASI